MKARRKNRDVAPLDIYYLFSWAGHFVKANKITNQGTVFRLIFISLPIGKRTYEIHVKALGLSYQLYLQILVVKEVFLGLCLLHTRIAHY